MTATASQCWRQPYCGATTLRPSHPYVTVMLRPARKSHTVCVFKDGDGLRTFDNRRLREEVHETYGQVADELKEERGDRLVCWDVVDPETLKIIEFRRAVAT